MLNEQYVSEIIGKLEQKVDRMIAQLGEKSPHFAGKDGVYDDRETNWWTSAFWPGILWVMHDVTGKPNFKEAAWNWDAVLEPWLLERDALHHDVGFQFLSSAVIKHSITGDEDALRRGLAAANDLAGRFNPAGRFIRAWNGEMTGWAIIDCMMNISLLFWAHQITGDPRYKHIAMMHADTAIEHFIRPDGSAKHIVCFDPDTGEVLEVLGGQGFAPDSAWSRGTAWALHGFANTYRYTGEARYLETAKRIAHFFLASLPEDRVPYWDFRLPTQEGEPRDSSAGAIAASGLLEIAGAVPEYEKHVYMDGACGILRSLTENYGTWDQPEHQAILVGATGHKPAGKNIDGSLIYGDYFYVEAFAKLAGWKHRVY